MSLPAESRRPNVRLDIDHLDVAYEGQAVITDLSFRVPEGKITALVGRNGSGKSTLLRTIGRLLRPAGGAVLLDGVPIVRLPTKRLAQQLAVLPQGPTAPDGVTVRNLVEHGRYPHRSFLGSNSEHDHQVIAWALQQTGLVEMADRPLSHLSGGQQQRAWIAMALAQDTEIILLDEPTTFLDVAHQLELMHLLQNLNQQNGTTIVMASHDLNQAAQYCHALVALKDGTVYAAGRPDDVFTAQMIRDVFGLEADVIREPRAGSLLCIPRASVADTEATGPSPLAAGVEA